MDHNPESVTPDGQQSLGGLLLDLCVWSGTLNRREAYGGGDLVIWSTQAAEQLEARFLERMHENPEILADFIKKWVV